MEVPLGATVRLMRDGKPQALITVLTVERDGGWMHALVQICNLTDKAGEITGYRWQGLVNGKRMGAPIATDRKPAYPIESGSVRASSCLSGWLLFRHPEAGRFNGLKYGHSAGSAVWGLGD